MVSIILKPAIIGAHSLCPQLSPDLFSKSIIEQPSVPLPPLMVQIFSSLSSSLAVARGSMPDCPSQRRRQREGERERAASLPSLLFPLSALHGILHSRKEERERDVAWRVGIFTGSKKYMIVHESIYQH